MSAIENMLDQALAPGDHPRASVAWNVRNDWRASVERMAEFSDCADKVAASRGLATRMFFDTIAQYNKEHGKFVPSIGGTRIPSFLHKGINGTNFYGVPGGLPGIAPDYLLATILDLTALSNTYDHGCRGAGGMPAVSEFADFKLPAPSTKAPAQVMDWLDSKLGSGPEIPSPGGHPFLKATVAHLGASISSLPYEPVWAASWNRFEAVASGDPAEWRAWLGMPTEEPKWLLLMVYPACRAMPVVRPTQLDAGYFPVHFPNPPGSGDGLAMKLAPDFSAARMPEYIHPRLDHRRWLDDPAETPIWRCVRVGGRPAHHLPDSQRHHMNWLGSRFPKAAAWTASHPVLAIPPVVV